MINHFVHDTHMNASLFKWDETAVSQDWWHYCASLVFHLGEFRLFLCVNELNSNFSFSNSSFISALSLCIWLLLLSSNWRCLLSRLVLIKSSHMHTHRLYLWLRLSVNNANGQQANEHVMADWKGINERTHDHTQEHTQAGSPRLTKL